MASTPPPKGSLFPHSLGDPRLATSSPHRLTHETAAVAAAVSAEDVPRLLSSMRQQTRESLARYHYENARFYAERLFELDASYRHLHLLAHTYVETGGEKLAAAQQMLELHYPFFPLESNQTLSTAFMHRAHASLVAEKTHAAFASSLSGTRASARADSVDLLSTDVEVSRDAVATAPSPPASTPVVDVVSRWWCQYLFAVCCARGERFREGAKVLNELRGISATLQSAFASASLTARAAIQTDGGGRQPAPPPRRTTHLTGAMAALYEQDSAEDFFATMEERLADVDYWLGFCTTRYFLRQDTSEYFLSAARRDPTLLAAFDSYTQHMREPPSNCVEDLFSDAAFQRASAARPAAHVTVGSGGDSAGAAHRSSEVEEGTVMRSRAHTPSASSPLRHSAPAPLSASPPPLNAFIRRYARVMFLQRTYRGSEVVTALAQLPTRAGAENNSNGDKMRRTETQTLPMRAQQGSSRTAWAWLQMGLAYFHSGQMEESAAAFDHAIRGSPWRLDDPALIYYSTALWQLRDESRLGALAHFLVDKAPFSAVTLCVMANTYSLSEAPHDAVAMLERASQVDNTLAYAHCLRGYELLALGQREEASEAFKSALSIDPRHYMSFAGIGERCLRDEQLPEARNCFRLAISINPLPAIMNRLTATYHRSDATHKDLTDALAIYERTIAQHPQNSFAASHQRADVLLRLGRAQEAYTALLALQRQRPREAVVQVTLARCLQCLGDTQQAIAHYHRAMALDPRREGYVRCALERIASNSATHAVS